METHQVHFIYGTFVFPGRTKYASHGRRGHSTTPTGGTLQVNTYLKHITEGHRICWLCSSYHRKVIEVVLKYKKSQDQDINYRLQ